MNIRDVARAVEMVKHGCISEKRSCLSKVSFPNRNDAIHAAKAVANKTGRETSVYSCSWCSGWHVTKAKWGEQEGHASDDVEVPSKLRRGATQ